MKRVLSLFILISHFSFAQQQQIDSVIQLLSPAKEDTTTALRFGYIADQYRFGLRNDSLAELYAKKALTLSTRLKYNRGICAAKLAMANYKDIPRSIELAYEAMNLSEQDKDTVGIMESLFTQQLLYASAENFTKALELSKRLTSIAEINRDTVWRWAGLYNNALRFSQLDQPDSALPYAQEAYRYAIITSKLTDRRLTRVSLFPRERITGWSLLNLGGIQSSLGEKNLALHHYLEALSLYDTKKGFGLYFYHNLLFVLAGGYLDVSKNDSAIIFALTYLKESSNKTIPSELIMVYEILAKAYRGRNNDSSLIYYELASKLRKEQFSEEKKSKINQLTRLHEENEKQKLLEKNRERQRRQRNLQYTFIGIALITFIVVYLLLSQSFIVRSGFIRFLGVVALLLLFEFINLLVHPFVSELTHHSPFWIFIIMVCIAALLVPAHHRLESLLIQRLIEKNRNVRLANAKKTIRELEG